MLTLAKISCILWIIIIACIFVFVLLMFCHMMGSDDHTIELNFLFKVIIYGIAVALIIFLISQYNDIKHMNEIIEKIQATHF